MFYELEANLKGTLIMSIYIDRQEFKYKPICGVQFGDRLLSREMILDVDVEKIWPLLAAHVKDAAAIRIIFSMGDTRCVFSAQEESMAIRRAHGSAYRGTLNHTFQKIKCPKCEQELTIVHEGSPVEEGVNTPLPGMDSSELVKTCEGLDAEMLDAMYQVHVAPIRRGKWLPSDIGVTPDPDDVTLKCSECHFYISAARDEKGVVMGTPYCPNCGAKMDKEE